jgi:hypothetical protein
MLGALWLLRERRGSGELALGPRGAAHAQATTGFDGGRWSTAPEAVAYDMAGELIGGPAGLRSPAPARSPAAWRH